MSLRDRLLALLRDPAYAPGNEFELSRRLNLKKRERAALAHEVRLALKSGEFARGGNGRISPAGGSPPASAPTKRAIFVPTRRSATKPAAAPAAPVAHLPTPVHSAGKAAAAKPAAKTARGAHTGPTRLTRGKTSQPRKSHRAATPTPVPVHVPEPVTTAPALEPPPILLAPAPVKVAPAPHLRSGELVGRIQFRAGGSAFVVREGVEGEAAQPALQVFSEDTGVALPGDRVVAREFPGRKGRRPGEKVGEVVRVLERSRDTIVGDLRATRRGYVVQPDDPRFSLEIQVEDPADADVTPAPRPGDKVVVKLGRGGGAHPAENGHARRARRRRAGLHRPHVR